MARPVVVTCLAGCQTVGAPAAKTLAQLPAMRPLSQQLADVRGDESVDEVRQATPELVMAMRDAGIAVP